jgi:hypothetical protein
MLEEDLSELKKQIEEHERRISSLEKRFQSRTKTSKTKLSIQNFILNKTPQNDVHKALAIGYYLEKYDGFSSFTSKEIENGFIRAREILPGNVSDKIKKNKENGYMMNAVEKKEKKLAYVLTNQGIAFVENNFEDE